MKSIAILNQKIMLKPCQGQTNSALENDREINKDSQTIKKVAPVSDAGEKPNAATAKPEKERNKESFEVIKGYA